MTDYAIYMLDLSGRVVSWNPGARRFKGYEADEIIGRHFSVFYTEEDLSAGIPERALKTAADEGRFVSEGWRLRKDGSRFWAAVVIDPIRDAGGALIGYAKITRDLSERKAAEEALRRSEEQFRLFLNSVVDYAIYMLDEQGNISSWNAGAQRIKGYAAAEVIGQHFSRFYTPEDKARGLPAFALGTAAAEGRFENEGWRVRKDGSRFWAHVVIDAVRAEDGALIGYAKITRDITERRAAQTALEKAREQLFQSQKLEAIGRLTGGVAHDFNNLLMAIMSSLELSRRHLPENTKLRMFYENAYQAAQRGVGLTQRMLAFARRRELKLEAVDVTSLVYGMSALLERTLGPRITIAVEVKAPRSVVRADANELESAILNLAVNARDAMPAGGVLRIAVLTEMVVQPGSPEAVAHVVVRISDTGEGMDDATLRSATEPFFTTKGVGKGTGLGLSMVYGMTEQLGGLLRLSSIPAEGTTVEIVLPAIDDAVRDTAPRLGLPAAPAEAPGRTVLVVDDDPLVRTNTVAMAEELGHVVFEAASGREALDLLRRQPVDIVVTDHAMPQMTGAQLARELKVAFPALPVMIVTGYAELPKDVDPGLPKLMKPFTLNQLSTLIQQQCSAARGQTSR